MDELARDTADASYASTGEPSGTLSEAGEAGDGTIPPPRPRGDLIGRYVSLSVLGMGGMGVVYAAYDPDLDRKIALKLLRPSALSVDYARLLREARTLAKLAHSSMRTAAF